MKKIIALLLCFSFIFLFACSNNNQDNIKYINTDETEGIGKDYASSWDDYKSPTESGTGVSSESADVTQAPVSASELLPENFPQIPEGISDLTIEKMPYSESTGYPSEYVEINFICEYINLVLFSQSLKDAGYKGGIKEITDGTYYPTGIHGAWQDGKHLVRIVGTQAIIGGTHDVTIHVLPCADMFPSELARLSGRFNGFCGAEPYYYEYVDGTAVERDFDGGFHAKWKMTFVNDCSFVGVTRADFEEYCEELESKGYTIGSFEAATLDGCNTFLGDALSNDESIYIMILYNESLSTLDLYFTNDIEGFEKELYGE